jgi:RNA polymerase sigma-70 factor (ECF subfamily)
MARLCIDALRSRKSRREDYVGPWLPEPWRTAAPENDDAPRQLELADDLSVAFLLLLERLGPDERAAFLLHDIFEADYDDIASSLGKSETAVRQLVSRARQRVAEDRRRFHATRAEQQELARRFKHALVAKDERALFALFRPDATLVSDGGGKALAALRPIYGADKIVRFFVGVTKNPRPGRLPVRRLLDQQRAGDSDPRVRWRRFCDAVVRSRRSPHCDRLFGAQSGQARPDRA